MNLITGNATESRRDPHSRIHKDQIKPQHHEIIQRRFLPSRVQTSYWARTGSGSTGGQPTSEQRPAVAHWSVTMSATCPCLCASIRDLSQNPDEARTIDLAQDLNDHLRDLQKVLAYSKEASREIDFKITPNNGRVKKTFSFDAPDLETLEQICSKVSRDPTWFWDRDRDNTDEAVGECSVHVALQRRLACIVVFLRSLVDAQAPIPSYIEGLFQSKCKYRSTDIRNAGRKYINISKKLGDLGSIFWLPTSVPYTT